MFSKKLQYATRQSIDSATFTGSYQALGSALAHPASIVKVVNNSNQLVDVSTNGTDDHDVAPQNSFFLYDATANSPKETGSIFLSKGTQVYVKGSAGTGLVYLVVLYIVES